MNHLAHLAAVPDGEPIEIRTWCDRLASSLAIEDSIVFEAILTDCRTCSEARADALHNAKPIVVVTISGVKTDG